MQEIFLGDSQVNRKGSKNILPKPNSMKLESSLMKSKYCLAVIGVLASAVGSAQAGVILPQFDTFGSLPAATFGGSGIPNNAVAITTISDHGNTITLGLTATQRFFNPALANDGAGTFYATPGANFGTPATPTTPGTPSSILGSTWNLGWYISTAVGASAEAIAAAASYQFELVYDLDAGLGTDVAAHGVLSSAGIGALSSISGPPPTAQSSQNMNFAFWQTSIPGGILAPGVAFDPNALGEYTFSLRAFGSSGKLIGESAIAVVVVPEPSTYVAGALLALPFGFGLLRRRFAAR